MAIKSRDPAANTAFYYGVTSTSIFCRPTCPARVARRDNIVFFDNIPTAEMAGYRPCRRCDPQNTSWHRDMRSKTDFDTAKALIERSEKQREGWSVAIIAEKVGISIGHLHRLFKRFANTTPKEFACNLTNINAEQKSSSSDWKSTTFLDAATSQIFDLEHDDGTRFSLQSDGYILQEYEALNRILIAEGLLPSTEKDGWTDSYPPESHEEILNPLCNITTDGADYWDFLSSTDELDQSGQMEQGRAFDELLPPLDNQLL